MKLSFTFADFGLLEPAFRHHFRVLPPGCPTKNLVTVSEWVQLPWREATRKVPFIWAVNNKNELLQLAISRILALAARDRLSYWRTLQELGGVNSLYARRAAESARKAALAEFQDEKNALVAAHEETVARIRHEEGAEVMRRLAEALVSQDMTRLASSSPRQAPSTRGAAAAPSAPSSDEDPPPIEPDNETEDEDDLSFDDPYIDTVLCTSCNECINLNPHVFVYNANKQAMIGDPSAGTFQQIVIAAEKCPARCIHPGKPKNPDEPGLDALLERARPFN